MQGTYKRREAARGRRVAAARAVHAVHAVVPALPAKRTLADAGVGLPQLLRQRMAALCRRRRVRTPLRTAAPAAPSL